MLSSSLWLTRRIDRFKHPLVRKICMGVKTWMDKSFDGRHIASGNPWPHPRILTSFLVLPADYCETARCAFVESETIFIRLWSIFRHITQLQVYICIISIQTTALHFCCFGKRKWCYYVLLLHHCTICRI